MANGSVLAAADAIGYASAHGETSRHSYMPWRAQPQPCQLYKVRLALGSGAAQLPFRRAALNN